MKNAMVNLAYCSVVTAFHQQSYYIFLEMTRICFSHMTELWAFPILVRIVLSAAVPGQLELPCDKMPSWLIVFLRNCASLWDVAPVLR